MMNSRLKNTQKCFCGIHVMPNEDMNKKKVWIQYIGGRDDQIATGAKLLDIK